MTWSLSTAEIQLRSRWDAARRNEPTLLLRQYRLREAEARKLGISIKRDQPVWPKQVRKARLAKQQRLQRKAGTLC